MARRYPRIQPRTAPAVPQFNQLLLNAVPLPPTLPPLESLLPSPLTLPVLNLPKQSEASWSPLRLFDGVSRTAAYSRFDCFAAATLARAAYTDNEDVHDQIQVFLQSKPWVRRSIVQSGITCVWYEYPAQTGTMVSIPGTTTFSQWVSYVAPYMKDDGLHANLTEYAGIKPYKDAYIAAFESVYNPSVSGNPRFSFVGHSLGGALAHVLAFEERVGVDPPGDEYNPSTLSCYTFGQPAFWLNTTNPRSQTRNIRVIRTVNPGDPVPDLVQQVIRTVRGFSTIGASLVGAPPQHYDTFTWRLDGTNNRKTQFWQAVEALRKNVIDAASDAFKPHKIASYCDGLERECLKSGDTPYPHYTSVVSLNRLLASIGK